MKPLTEMQTRVARALCAGHCGKTIACQLGIEYNTVRRHIWSIRNRMRHEFADISNLVGLMRALRIYLRGSL